MSSNIIKGFSQNFDATNFKKLDMSVREEKLAEKIEDLRSMQNGSFIAGITPVQVLEDSEYIGEVGEATESEATPEEEGFAQISQGSENHFYIPDLNEFRETVRQELYAEVRVQAEADFRENLQAEADQILLNARNEASLIIREAEQKAKVEAEAVKTGIISVASAEGYESGLKKAKEEQADALRALEDEKRRVAQDYERQVSELEPAFVEILKEYVKKITGVAYENHTEIITYLIDSAIRRAPGQTEFLVKLSPSDMDRFSPEIPVVVEKYKEKLALTFSVSPDVNDGEVRMENEGRILTSSIGLNMNGLLEALDLIALQ